MKPKIGIALGGGGAKGFSHIGVLRALEALSIKPDIIAGTSMGAVVGGLYAADKLSEIEEWALSLNIPDMVKYMDFKLVGGLLKGNKIVERLEQDVEGIKIDQLEKPFGAVVTNLDKGSEVWLRAGSLTQAIRASISIPGVFTPVSMDGYWMADGGLINPVPVSLCRAMGADYIIAVTLSEDDCTQELIAEGDQDSEQEVALDNADLRKRDQAKLILNDLKSKVKWPKSSLPSMMNLTMRSISIMTNTISRHRLTVEPTNFLLAPKVGDINMLDFRHAAKGIELGYEIVNESEHALLASLQAFQKAFNES